jgi:hypothetical protein
LTIPFAIIVLYPSLEPLNISYPTIDEITTPLISLGGYMLANLTPNTYIEPPPFSKCGIVALSGNL